MMQLPLRPLLLALPLLLAAAAPAQLREFDVDFPNVAVTPITWGGKPAILVVATRAYPTLAHWLPTTTPVLHRISLTLLAWLAQDARPCANGEHVYFSNHHLGSWVSRDHWIGQSGPGLALQLNTANMAPMFVANASGSWGTYLVADYVGHLPPQQLCGPNSSRYPDMVAAVFAVGLR